MIRALNTIWMALQDAGLMAWQVWWALVLGFAISAVVQAWVPRERIQHALAGSGLGPVARATGLGAASSSCSYAANRQRQELVPEGSRGVIGACLPVRLNPTSCGS